MRRFDRYIFREILTPGLIALVALTFIVFSQKTGPVLELILRHSPTAREIWSVVSAILPTVLTVTLPMAVLMGILTGFGRLSSDSEVIAMRASGIPMRRILVPVLAVASLAWICTAALTLQIAPQTASHSRTLQAQLALKYPAADLVRPRVFYEVPDTPYVLYFNDSQSANGLEAHGILLVDTDNPDQPKFTVAESGIITFLHSNRSLQLTLTNSSQHSWDPKECLPADPARRCPSEPKNYAVSSVARSTVVMDPDSNKPKSAPPAPPTSEQPTRVLWERLRSRIATLEETIEFHQRLALPLACFAFALMGLPLGVSTKRGGRSTGLVLSLILMFAYFLAFIGGARAAAVGKVSPILGVWAPNIAFTVLGTVLLSRSDRRYENRILGAISQFAEWAGEKLGAIKIRKPDISHWAYRVNNRLRILRLLDSYVLRGFWFFFSIVLGVFSSLFIIVTLFELLPDIIQNKVPAEIVAIYFAFLMPQIVYYVAPLAVLLAILINLGTLTKTNEVLAVKAGAVSLYRLSLPLLLTAALLSGAIYVLQDYVLPSTNRKQDEYHNIIKGRAPQTYRDPSRKLMMGSTAQVYQYAFFDPKTLTFGNLSVLTLDPKTFQVRERLFAKRATWSAGNWSFEEGWLRRFSEDHPAGDEQVFDRLPMYAMDPPSYFNREARQADQMNYAELQRYVEDLRHSGLDVGALTVDLYRKLSFPMVPFIMALIGIPFSFKTGRKGAFYGIGLCLALGIVYWSTFELFGKLGSISDLSPIIAAWFPNIIFGASGLWMTLRVRT